MGVDLQTPRRHRRSRAEMEEIRMALYETVAEHQPMTVRQVFYQLVSKGVIAKTEGEYKRTVVRLLCDMRREGNIPYSSIADNTRWMRKPTTHFNLRSMLTITAWTYRRALWNDQDAYVEIWLEKDALAGVVYEVTEEWDVPLMVTRGYPSLSFLAEAAEQVKDVDGKPTYLYYFGDRDPSGLDIPRFTEKQLVELAPSSDLTFERVAVTPEQIVEYHLPTRPTKKTDTRSKSFIGESVELDAIDPETLRDLVRDSITQHVDQEALEKTKAIELEEKATLERLEEHLDTLEAEDEDEESDV